MQSVGLLRLLGLDISQRLQLHALFHVAFELHRGINTVCIGSRQWLIGVEPHVLHIGLLQASGFVPLLRMPRIYAVVGWGLVHTVGSSLCFALCVCHRRVVRVHNDVSFVQLLLYQRGCILNFGKVDGFVLDVENRQLPLLVQLVVF